MTAHNIGIEIEVSEKGVRVVKSSIEDLGKTADKAGDSIDKTAEATNRLNRSKLGGVTTEFDKFASHVDRVVHKIRSRMTMLAALFGTTISTGSIVKAIDEYTNLQNKLRLVSDSQEHLNALTEEMFRLSARTRNDVGSTATAFQRFDMALKSVGKSQKDSLMVTEQINKMIAMSGKGAQESAAALLQLSQAFSKGKLDGDEFRTVAETMPMFMDALAKKLDTTRGGLLQMRKEGKITLDVMVEALREAQPEIDKSFSQLPLKMSDALTIIKNNWIKFWGEFDARFQISPKLTAGLLWLSDNFKLVASVGVAAVTAISISLTSRLLPAIMSTFAAIAANPFAAMSTAAVVAIVGIITYVTLMEDELRNSNTAIAGVGVFFLDMFDAVKAGWADLYDVTVDVLSKTTGKTQKSATKQTSIFQDFFDTTDSGFWGLLETAGKVIDMIASVIAGTLRFVIHNIGVDFSNLTTRIMNEGKSVVRWFNNNLSSSLELAGLSNPFAKMDTTPAPMKKNETWGESLLAAQTTAAEDAVKNAAARRKEAQAQEKLAREANNKLGNIEELLRGDNPDVARKIAAANRQAEAAKKAAKGGGSESKTFAEKTAEFAEKNARALDKYTGECAKYINNAVQAFAKNYKRAGSGIDVARNAVATGKYKWVKFDENYTPQVGDIQSMSSWTKLGLKHGHSSMFTKNGWVSDAKQKTYGDGRIGAASSDQYNKLKSGMGQLMIARPIDSKVDNRTYNKMYEQQEKALERQIDYYNQIIEKTEKEIQNLTIVGTTRLADMKTMEMMDSLKQHDVDLTTEQVAKVAELAFKYEEAKVAQELRDIAEGREKELSHLRAITIEEKAIADFNDYIASKRKEGIFYTEEQLTKLREESVEHARTVELLQAKNELWLNQTRDLDSLIVKQQALNELIASGQMGGQVGALASIRNQSAISSLYQGMGLNGYGQQAGLNPMDDLLASMEAGASKLLDGYSGTLNDLSNMFGDFFGQMKSGFADSIGSAIVDSENLGESLRKVGQGALKQLISGIIQMGINWVLTQALMKSSSKTAASESTTQGVAQATALTSAYAPAATLANIATYGSAGAAGMASTIAAVALASAIPSMFSKGFKVGGYTGNGGVNDIAGVVHGQEFVMDAQTTRRIGVSNLEALRNGSLSLSNGASVNGGQSSNITVKIENYASGVSHEVEQISENEIRIIARKEAQQVLAQDADGVVASNIRNNSSRTALAINSNFDVKQRR